MTIETPDDALGRQDPDAGTAPLEPADLAVLERASAELAVSTDREPSPGLLPAVMETVWAELRPGQEIPLPGSDGTLLVTETAVGNALVAHLDGLPELLVRRCAVDHQVPSGGADGADGAGTLSISLTAAVAYGTDTDELIQRIRSVITLAAQHLFGLSVQRVDIEIVDVYPVPGTLR